MVIRQSHIRLALLVIAALIIIVIAVIQLHNINTQPMLVPTPNVVNTNDPEWIVNHCNIPSVAKAHDILCG